MLLQGTAELLAAEHPGLPIETAQYDGAPAKVLLAQSRSGTIATVVGADGQGRLSRRLLRFRCRPGGRTRTRLHRRRRDQNRAVAAPLEAVIAVGVDGSTHSHAAIGFAYEEAALRGATLLAIHTWNDKPLNHALGSYPLDINATSIDDQEHRLLETELAGWEQKFPDVPVRMRVLRGSPAPNLLRYATITGSAADPADRRR